MRAVVFGRHNIGYACLDEALRQGHEVAAVVTPGHDPRAAPWFASVTELARERGLAVYSPSDPNEPAFVEQVRSLAPDIILSFSYPRLLGAPLLSIPPLGCLNLHCSCLPRRRERCPVSGALAAGETETGVTLHYMVPEPCAGDIVAQRTTPIDFGDTVATLDQKLTRAAREVLAQALPLLAAGTAPRLPQDHSRATRRPAWRSDDARFDWADSALCIYNLARAVTHPCSGAFTMMGDDKLLVWACYPHDASWVSTHTPGTIVQITPAGPVVATGDGTLALLALQLGAGPEMTGGDFATALGLAAGDSLCGRGATGQTI